MLRLGIVDFDSSHAVEFTQRINHVGVDSDQWVEGARVVAGWPGTSEMAPERIETFRPQVEACGVELVDSPEALIDQVDGILITSLCGGAHLERARLFLEANIPTFVDKPFACTLADAQSMINLAQETDCLLLHASALTYAEEVLQFQSQTNFHGETLGVVTYGPAKQHAQNPGLFHYGIHPTSLLFALMGPGCGSVQNRYSDGAEVVTGEWNDGRIATLRGNRAGKTSYGFVAFCTEAVVSTAVSARYAYRNLCQRIVNSFQSQSPLTEYETILEMTRFILAAQQSENNEGATVRLADV